MVRVNIFCTLLYFLVFSHTLRVVSLCQKDIATRDEKFKNRDLQNLYNNREVSN